MVCIYILPISGGAFPNQLALISALSESKNKKQPDICLASSGGNISAYIAMCNNWSETGIKAYIRKIKMNMFIESWIPILPTFLAFPFTGSFFRSGSGINSILHSSFNKASVQTCEIWTGTYNNTKSKSQIFCNKNKTNSRIVPDINDLKFSSSLEPVYLDGNISEITKALQASAAIPILINTIKIENNYHSDGGVMFPSPLSAMNQSLRKYFKSNSSEKVQLNYISCYNMDLSETQRKISQIESVFHGIMVTERELCISLFIEFCPNHKIEEFSDTSFMSKIIDKNYLIIAYPEFDSNINITNFDTEQILTCFDSARKKFKMRVYSEI